ncbi:SIMPL domain-containing protein [Rhodoligotrophos defluvii]|uniref:SIMPL domain-containing protein n=1 Tax=Rhodoligotrophos defluvii TaxID=2561934 RepID=UPI0014856132|nr:SIMPL domain-containing protein [Rhodoligotrophos defluvii]
MSSLFQGGRGLLPLVLTAGLLMGVVAAVPARAQDTQSEDQIRTLSLVGTGEVRAAPDEATITIGVVHQAKTAAEAVKANNAAMAEVFSSLKAEGIAEKDIQTSNFSVNPRYVYPKDNSGPPTIDGYEVSNQVSVRIHDLGKLGAVLDKVVASGSNQINGISFGLSEPEKLENEARKLAIADARAKAELYAQAGGFQLGPIHAVVEGGRSFPPVPMMRREAFDMKAAAQAVPIAQGEQVVSIQVNVTWEIR